VDKQKEKQKKALGILALLLLLAGVLGVALWPTLSKRGPSEIRIDKTGPYKLLADGKPFLVKGVCYSPVAIGKDYEFNFWGDATKPWLEDGRLMKAMGVNTVRFYKAGKNPEEVRRVIDDLYREYGIRTLMGTYLGFWNWPPPNYSDDSFKEDIKTEVLEMVRLYKDSPGVLMWILGNENNYSFDQNPPVQRWTSDAIDALPTPEAQRAERARLYYSFVNDLAKEIKKIDPRHPVVMGVGEVSSLEMAKLVCPDVDVLGMIAYRGPTFGNLFRQVKQKFDLPVLMIEYGADSFNALKRKPDEKSQAEFLKLQWKDIERNAYSGNAEGNSLGGVIFEWNDEWWKGNENLPHTWDVHEEAGQWGNPSYHTDAEVKDRLNINEEWFGVVGLEQTSEGALDKRVPKKSYETMKSLWVE